MLPGPSPACLLLVHSDGEPEQGTGLVKPNERGGGGKQFKKKINHNNKKKTQNTKKSKQQNPQKQKDK